MPYIAGLVERWTRTLQAFLSTPGTGDTPPPRAKRIDDLALYHYRGCPFCARVEHVLDELGIQVDMRNILSDRDYEAQLIQGGGKRQVPCLRIKHRNQPDEWLYESSAIIRELRERFG